jgi:hypothetical protein
MAREVSLPITNTDAVAHCRHAHEYLRAVEHSLAVGDMNAAVSRTVAPSSIRARSQSGSTRTATSPRMGCRRSPG